ncbi:MAG TPA: cyclase family protein [Bdellovibrionota bacterium]
MKIWDISPSISPKIAVFPGDVPFSREISMAFGKGDHLDLSSIRTTLHLGAHADSSSHYHKQGKGVDRRPLDRYLGSCQVIAVKIPKGARILPSHLGKTKIKAKRVLFRTGSFPDPDQWNSDFNSLSPELIDFLAKAGVVTVGIDTPSVDPADSKALESHNALYKRDLAVLEGIVLAKVPAGLYTLIALPLNLKDADASPVRAILLKHGLLKN